MTLFKFWNQNELGYSNFFVLTTACNKFVRVQACDVFKNGILNNIACNKITKNTYVLRASLLLTNQRFLLRGAPSFGLFSFGRKEPILALVIVIFKFSISHESAPAFEYLLVIIRLFRSENLSI